MQRTGHRRKCRSRLRSATAPTCREVPQEAVAGRPRSSWFGRTEAEQQGDQTPDQATLRKVSRHPPGEAEDEGPHWDADCGIRQEVASKPTRIREVGRHPFPVGLAQSPTDGAVEDLETQRRGRDDRAHRGSVRIDRRRSSVVHAARVGLWPWTDGVYCVARQPGQAGAPTAPSATSARASSPLGAMRQKAPAWSSQSSSSA